MAAATQPAIFQRDVLTCLLSIVMAVSYPFLSLLFSRLFYVIALTAPSLSSEASSGSLSGIAPGDLSLGCDPPSLKDSAGDHDDREEHGPERYRHTKLNEERRQHRKNRHPDEGAKHAALAA